MTLLFKRNSLGEIKSTIQKEKPNYYVTSCFLQFNFETYLMSIHEDNMDIAIRFMASGEYPTSAQSSLEILSSGICP